MRKLKTLNLAGKQLDLTTPLVMSIINITQDSFYSGSRNRTAEQILRSAQTALEQGSSIIDIGGYSSRPGAKEVPIEEEFARLDMAMAVIRAELPDFPISVDTFRSEIVEKLYDKYGDFIVNDISASELDRQMIPTVGRLSLPYIAMHMRGTPTTMQSVNYYDDMLAEMILYFANKIEQAQTAGIKDLIIDPGFGFAKNVEQNFELLSMMSRLKVVGKPILAGLSRKSMIWRTLETTPEQALNGTTALNWEALRQGADILRVHDTAEAVQTIKLYTKFRENNEHQRVAGV